MIDVFKSVFKNTKSDNLCLIEHRDQKMTIYTFDKLCDHEQSQGLVLLLGYFATGIFCDVSTITESHLVLPINLVRQLPKNFGVLSELAVAWDEYRRINELKYTN